jgi:hypothetical protein
MYLVDSNRFYLPGTNKRFLHLASVREGIREFVCFADLRTRKVYIEEDSGHSLEFIEDDSLVEELHSYLKDKHILDMSKPLFSDEEWLRYKPIEK